MAYLTKDRQGLVQLWNNKPEWDSPYFVAKDNNEVAIDVTANDYFRGLCSVTDAPLILSIEIMYKKL